MKVHESTSTVTVHIDRPAEEVFDYITNAGNWTKWHPATAWVKGDATTHPARVGEVITERVKHGPMRDTFTWNVEECRPPERWAIRGKGRMFGQKVLITYDLSPEDGGTRWVRAMTFFFPKAYAYLDKLLLNRILEKNSEKAVRQLKELLRKG